MPNIRGGKAYKKSKGKSKLEDDAVVYLDKGSDQMVGRIVRLLGNLNAQVYCEDNKQRICKISRGIKKHVRFEAGDVVLISTRDCEVPKADLEKGLHSDRGDILDRYHPQQYDQLKEEGISSAMFVTLTKVSEIASLLAKGDIAGAEAVAAGADDDLFDRGGEEDEEEEDVDKMLDKEMASNIVDKRDKPTIRIQKKPLAGDDVDLDTL